MQGSHIVRANRKHLHTTTLFIPEKHVAILPMKDLIDEHFRLRLELDQIEAENRTRNMLIHLCTLKVLSLRKGVQTPPTPEKDAKDTEKKLLEYELRVSVLKLQLSTKEKVHEAQIDELKDVVADLRKQLDEQAPKTRERTGGTSVLSSRSSILSPPSSSGRVAGGRSISAGSSFLMPSRSVFDEQAPLRKKRVLKLKDTTPVDFGISLILSQASLKLSDTKKADRHAPANTNTEATLLRANATKATSAVEAEKSKLDVKTRNTNPNESGLEMPDAPSESTVQPEDDSLAKEDTHTESLTQDNEAPKAKVAEPENDSQEHNAQNNTQEHNTQNNTQNNTQEHNSLLHNDTIPKEEGFHSTLEQIRPEQDSSAEKLHLGKHATAEVTDTEDETFHSANNTLLGETKKKRKKIQLVASEASTVIVPQAQELGVDDENLNSLNYYNDENFKEDNSSPIRPGKRRHSPESEPAVKKRHVFKI